MTLYDPSSTQYQKKTWNHMVEYSDQGQQLGDLPEGWELGLSPSGRIYFVNHHTCSTTWIDPRTKCLRYDTLQQCTPGDLPYGWDELYTIDGTQQRIQSYFINNLNGRITLTDPTRVPKDNNIEYMDRHWIHPVYRKLTLQEYWTDQVRSIEAEYIRGCHQDDNNKTDNEDDNSRVGPVDEQQLQPQQGEQVKVQVKVHVKEENQLNNINELVTNPLDKLSLSSSPSFPSINTTVMDSSRIISSSSDEPIDESQDQPFNSFIVVSPNRGKRRRRRCNSNNRPSSRSLNEYTDVIHRHGSNGPHWNLIQAKNNKVGPHIPTTNKFYKDTSHSHYVTTALPNNSYTPGYGQPLNTVPKGHGEEKEKEKEKESKQNCKSSNSLYPSPVNTIT